MNNIIVSPSPHIRDEKTTQGIMVDVCIALLPALIASVLFFGYKSIVLSLLCILFSVGFEYLWQKLTKSPVTISDGTAVVTGLLLAFNLPVSAPWWICLIGSFVAIIIVKQFFGGVGNNFMNPALAGRAFLLASWPVIMTTWTNPFGVDAVSSATPMAVLKDATSGTLPKLLDMFTGNIPGCIGETSAIALIIGGIYLIARKVISARIPIAYILTVALFTFIFPSAGLTPLYSMAYNVLGGGLMLGAIFMATDYVTSPITSRGQIVMGIGCGILTFVIRRFGAYPEGVSYSILLMNVATPLIDRWTKPRAFGTQKGGKK